MPADINPQNIAAILRSYVRSVEKIAEMYGTPVLPVVKKEAGDILAIASALEELDSETWEIRVARAARLLGGKGIGDYDTRADVARNVLRAAFPELSPPPIPRP